MKTPKEVFEVLKEKFEEDKIEFREEEKFEPSIIISRDVLREAALYLRDNAELDFNVLMCLSGVHYPEENSLTVAYHINSTTHKHSITLKTTVGEADPHVPSVESVWKTADWHEREAYDMLGIYFEGHPDLRRILCPDDWEGYPLRKDYKQQEFYRGIKVPY